MPEISLNPDGNIKITGRSMNCNITEFSRQIDIWLDEYIWNPVELTRVDIYLEYLDVTNLKFYYAFLKKIESSNSKGKKYIMNWYYEEGDEDILEKGEDLSLALGIPFNFIMINDPLIPESDSLKWKTSEV